MGWKHKDGTKVASEVVDVVTRMDDEKLFKTYSILKFIPEKDEEIVCTAYSEQYRAPRVSNGLKIRLKYKPRIELELSNEIIEEGGTLEAVCKAEAYPVNMVCKWFINDIEVGFSEKQRMIQVMIPPTILKHPQTKFGRPDEVVTFSCKAEGSSPPRYIWVRSKTNELVGVGQSLSLTVSEETEGEYACKIVAGDHTPQTSDSARLVMKRKPRIEAELTKTAERGKDVLLSCKVRNTFPGTEMVWANKGQPLEIISDKFKIIESHDDNINEISSDLVITNVDSEDFKEYGCFASNELGSDYQTIKLVEETSPTSFVITVIVNSMGGVAIIILCVWLWFR